jgi:hypothetical protein
MRPDGWADTKRKARRRAINDAIANAAGIAVLILLAFDWWPA